MPRGKSKPPAPTTTPEPQPGSNELVLRQELADTRRELDLALKVNAELTKEVERLAPYDPLNANKPVLNSSTASFVHQGLRYGFAYPQIRMDGRVVTADEVASNEALQAELVNRKSGMIKLLTS